MKKKSLNLSKKLLLNKEGIARLTTEQQLIEGGTGGICAGSMNKTCPNSCILTLCNTPLSTACPPTS